MNVQPHRPQLLQMLLACLESGPTVLQDQHSLFKRLYKVVCDKVKVVTGNSRMEERRAQWTTYNKINTFFDSLHEKLVDLGFA